MPGESENSLQQEPDVRFAKTKPTQRDQIFQCTDLISRLKIVLTFDQFYQENILFLFSRNLK
jgi:hypothetical protein